MAQPVRIKEMEEYIRKVGELLNLVYGRLTDLESKVNPLKEDVSNLKKEVEALKAENTMLKEKNGGDAISKGEYEEFVNRFVDSLKGIFPEAPQKGT